MSTNNQVTPNNAEVVVNLPKTLEGFTPCSLVAHTTTFAKKIRYPEIGVDEDLPSKFVTSGQKLMLPKEVAEGFKQPIDQAKAYMDTYCLPWGKEVWLIPIHKMDDVKEKLKTLKSEFQLKKTLLKFSYEDKVEAHAQECDLDPVLNEITKKSGKTFGYFIREQHLSWEKVDKKLEFEFSIDISVEYKVKNSYLDDVANKAITHLKQINGTADAKAGKVKLTPKNIKWLFTIRERLLTARLLEPNVQYIIDLIDGFALQFGLNGDEEKFNSSIKKVINEEKNVNAFKQLLVLMASKQIFENMVNYGVKYSAENPYNFERFESDLDGAISLKM